MTVPTTASTKRTRRLVTPWPVLAVVVAASVAARAISGLRIEGLWIAPDEMVWAALGQSLWEHGDLRLLGGEQKLFGVVYPALVGGPLVLAGLERGYDILKVVQPVVMSATAVPVYLWARRVATPGWSLVAAVLTLAIPGLLYSGLIMSETVFYPAVVLAAWATAAALEQPTLGRQGLLVAAVLLAGATRLQALVLPLAVLTAALLHALIVRDARRVLRLWPALAAFAVLGGAWVLWRTLAAGSPTGALGGYAPAAEADYGLGHALRFTAYHGAALVLLVAIFPLCAVALLLIRALAGREPPSALAAYMATAGSLALWLVAQTGVFTSVFVNGFSDRYLLPLAPMLFVGFAAWLSRGAERPRFATAAVVLGVFSLLAYLPLQELVVQEAAWQSLTVVPLIWLREHVSESGFELAFWGGAATALVAFALVPRRAIALLPALTVALLVTASAASTREVVQNVAFDQRNLVGRHAWVDAAAAGPAAYLYVREFPANVVWQQLFWNEELRRVYALGGLQEEVGLPLAESVHADDLGRLVLPDGSRPAERYAVAIDAVTLEGAQLDRVELGYELYGLRLWRLDPPARIRSIRTGVRQDGDMHEPGVLTAWDCSDGRLELTLLPKASTRVELRVNGELQRTIRFAGEPFVNTTVFPPPGAAICRFEVIPDSLLGSTRFEFVRD